MDSYKLYRDIQDDMAQECCMTIVRKEMWLFFQVIQRNCNKPILNQNIYNFKNRKKIFIERI